MTIPDGIPYIGYESFYYCIRLSSITIPSTVHTVAPGAFIECTSLTSIVVEGKTTADARTLFESAASPAVDDISIVTGSLG